MNNLDMTSLLVLFSNIPVDGVKQIASRMNKQHCLEYSKYSWRKMKIYNVVLYLALVTTATEAYLK